MKKIVVDLDGTLTVNSSNSYDQKPPNEQLISKLREYSKEDFKICIFSARNMASYDGNIGKININTLPGILKWLDRHNVPYQR